MRPVWAQSIDDLGDLPVGFDSSLGSAISADGLVVVGSSSGLIGGEAFRWTQASGIVGLGDLPGGAFSSHAYAVSADGSVIVGESASASGLEAFRWTEAGGMVGLGDLPGGAFYSRARGVSADGAVIVGTGAGALGIEAFRWTEAGGMVGLGDLPGGGFYSSAHGVSADGSVIVGESDGADGLQAFRWTEAGGMVGLGDLSGGTFYSNANAVSANGLVIVGESDSGGYEAFRWTEAGGMVGLGYLPGGTYSSALATNADGSVIVGQGIAATGVEAFRWTEAAGMESIAGILTAAEVDLTGWNLFTATGTNADGSVVVGSAIMGGVITAYIATLSAGGVTTPEALMRSLVPATVPSQQSGQAVSTGLGQSLFAASHAAAAVPLPRQVASASAADASLWVPARSGYSAYAVGSLGLGQDNDGGNWGLNGTLGLLMEVTPELHLGAGVIGAHGDTDLDYGGESRLRALGASVIASYERPEGLRLYGSAFAAGLDVETDRHYLNGAGIDGSRGETEGIGYGAAVRGGWSIPLRLDTSVMPYGELQWSRTKLNGYSETGGAFPASFSSQTARELTSRLGASVSHRFSAGLELRARAAWGHRLSGDGGSLTATTLGLTQTLSGAEGDRNWAEGAVSAVWRVTQATTVMAEIGGRSGRTPEPAATATLGVTVQF